MKFDENPKQTAKLTALNGQLKKVRSNMPALVKSRTKQAGIVAKLDAELNAKLDAFRQGTETDPAKIRKAKLEIVDLDQQHEDEVGMLAAYEKAILNLRNETVAEARQVSHEVDRILSKAFTDAEPGLLKKLEAIVCELMAGYQYQHGPHAIQPVENAFNAIFRKPQNREAAVRRVSAAKKALLDSVNA